MPAEAQRSLFDDDGPREPDAGSAECSLGEAGNPPSAPQTGDTRRPDAFQ